MTRVAILQPTYWARTHVWNRVLSVDTFVWLDTVKFSRDALKWDDPRVRVVKLAGASYRADALQDDGFAPGRRLALVREPENEHDTNAVAVYDAERRVQAGYVPAEVAPELRGDEQAVSLWEFRGEDGQRIGLRVLLAPADAWIQEPRS